MTADQWKLEEIAKFIEGRVIDDSERVEVCIKGTVLGFPATLEAFRSTFPFGVTYFIEIAQVDKMQPMRDGALSMSLSPRLTRGIVSFFARLLLFEPKGQQLNEPRIRSNFITTYNNRDQAERFVSYPGVLEKLLRLEHYAKFSELMIRSDAGLSLSQPTAFKNLELDVCRETFKSLSELGQVLFEAF